MKMNCCQSEHHPAFSSDLDLASISSTKGENPQSKQMTDTYIMSI